MVAIINYMSQILVELVKLANLIITITKALACADRVAGVLAIPSGEEVQKVQGAFDAPAREEKMVQQERQRAHPNPTWSLTMCP